MARILVCLSLLCFVVAWLLAVDFIFHNGNQQAWIDGGFIFWLLSVLVPHIPTKKSVQN